MAKFEVSLHTGERLVVESLLSDREAAALARRAGTSFAMQLADMVERDCALSERQRAWLHAIADATARGEAAEPRTYPKTLALFDRAASEKPNTKLEVVFDGVRLYRTGPKSPAGAGTISVRDAAQHATWYGRIDRDAIWHSSRGVSAQRWMDRVLKILDRIESHPERVARQHGQVTGRCFCGATLSDPVSIAHGYGRDCARAFGLPWNPKEA